MDSFLGRYKNLLVLVTVLVVQIVGLAAQIRRPSVRGDGAGVRLLRSWAAALVTPPERLLHNTTGGLSGLWANYVDLRRVRQENQNLKAHIDRLQMEQAALLEDARQGQRLQKLLAFREHYVSATVPAQVIGTSGTDQSHVLLIDKGSADGLKPDMAVITPEGILGKLRDVFRHTSQVLEISDQSSGVGVLLETTRLRGVLRGNALGQPEIVNLLPDERIKPGERVITSGGDQIFPRGLLVGIVDHVVPDLDNPPYVGILIKPAAKLGHVGEVLVITATSGEMTAQAQKDIAQSAEAAAAAPPMPARAADILAERLPGLDARPDASKSPSAEQLPPPVVAPLPLRTDRYTPNATPPAADLVPGQPVTPLAVAAVPVVPQKRAASAPASRTAAPAKPPAPSAGFVPKPRVAGKPSNTTVVPQPKHGPQPASSSAAEAIP